MPKLLVNNPHGVQELLEVGEGGGYFDESRVLWDDRKHGPCPPDLRVGGMVLASENPRILKFEQPVFVANRNLLDRMASEMAVKSNAKEAARARLAAIDWAKVNTVADLKAIVRDMLEG